MIKVKKLLNEGNWIKGGFAKDKEDELVQIRSKEACKWCLLGAIRTCYGYIETIDVIRKIEQNIGIQNLIRWNDSPKRTWNDVKELIEELDI